MSTYTELMYIECIGTEFGTLQIRQHIWSVEIPDVKITSVDCSTKLIRPFFTWSSVTRLLFRFIYINKNESSFELT